MNGFVQDEAARQKSAAEYRRKWDMGLIGPRYAAMKEAERKREIVSAVPDLPDPNWGKDAKGRKVWVGPTDADGNPAPEGGM